MRRIAVLVLGLLSGSSAASLSAQAPARSGLFKDSRAELAQARVRGEKDVLLVMAARTGRNAALADAVRSMGGEIQFRDDEVDYLRARIPLDQIEALSASAFLHSADVSLPPGRPRALALAGGGGPSGPDRPQAEGTGAPAAAPTLAAANDTIWPPVLTDRPLVDRYHPWGDTRALTYLEEHPTYDGRGVTIAMIDMNPDMLLPELQTAKALDGSDIPKVALYGTALDVREEDDGRWLHMDDAVQAVGGMVTYRDSTYRTPGDGAFRMALFDESGDDQSQGEAVGKDVNRDGNPPGSSRLFGVLWNEASGEVRVDTDQDRDFTDETALTDFRERRGFGVFGTDKPETPVRESVGFGVSIDKDAKLVALNLGVASHASLVVGAAVGSRGENGRFDGMAPGAQLISISEGGSAYGQIESTIRSAQAGADVMYFEQSSYITRTYLPRDGRMVASVIGERLVERYGVSILSPTHNYPIVGAIDDLVMGRGVIGVNGHESKENFFLNHGVRVEHDDNLLITGGYGPMGDGSLKPDILSPSNYVSTAQGFVDGRSIPGLFELPPGYTIAGGTSTATPTAAGAVGLLISGAKQAGLDYDPYKVKWAVTRGARWVPHIDAYKQGNGVISVAGAWEVLNDLQNGGMMVDISSRAAVRHPYSHLLPTPHVGEGIYERSGWTKGDRGTRTVTFTRTSGPGAAMTFDVEWDGNDHGTFSSARTITLPLNTPVDFPVTVAPEDYGVHTAHLTLRNSQVTGHAYRTLATVIAARPLNAANGFTEEVKVMVPRPGITSRFVHVPEGTQALMVDLGWEDRAVSLAVSGPDTRQVRGEQLSRGSGVANVIHDPMPGVWEIRLTDISDTQTFDWEQAKKDEPVPPTPATLTVSAMAVDITQLTMGTRHDAGSDDDAAHGGHAMGQVQLTNRMAAFTGGARSTAMGSARVETMEIGHKEQRVFEVEVLPGSESLIAQLGHLGDAAADLDLYVFNCTDKEDGCEAFRVDGDPVGQDRVVVADPAAGMWKIVIDAFNVPSGTISVGYQDVVINPSYGAVNTTDTPQERKPGDRWLAQSSRWNAPASHGPGRLPWAGLLIQGTKDGQAFSIGMGALGHGNAGGS